VSDAPDKAKPVEAPRGPSEAEVAANDPGFVKALQTLNRVLGMVEHGLLALFLGTLVAVGAYTAIARNFLHESPAWGDAVIRISVFFIAMAGAALAAQADQLIRWDVLSRALSRRGRAISRLVSAVFAIGMCGLLAYASLDLRSGALASEHGSEVLSAATVSLAIPLGSALIAVHIFVQAVTLASRIARNEFPEEETQSVH
jgi:TRAP-type C4-dicarboxylate transport system permease small subunit